MISSSHWNILRFNGISSLEVEYLGADRSAFAGGESLDRDLKLKVAELLLPVPLANYLAHVVAGNLPISDLHGSSRFWAFFLILYDLHISLKPVPLSLLKSLKSRPRSPKIWRCSLWPWRSGYSCIHGSNLPLPKKGCFLWRICNSWLQEWHCTTEETTCDKYETYESLKVVHNSVWLGFQLLKTKHCKDSK